jgi:alpha-ketoglutaric semialdehyde dehydrogenase
MNMAIDGKHRIAGVARQQGQDIFRAVNPVDGQALDGDFADATLPELNDAVRQAEEAFGSFRQTGPAERAAFLSAIAEEIEALGDALIARAMAETALPEGRLTGERGRTVGQLRLFAELVAEGSWVQARIDLALPDRKPLPRPDIRQMLQPLGPVVVFGASNFPLAFSVAGGDTASALAAGCPVVVKGHPAHPGTSEWVARAIVKAANRCDIHPGVFSLVHGRSHDVGEYLVKHPLIQGVAFTGSFRGGKALFDLACRRQAPIPVYAEMGSSNPVFLLPGILSEQAATIAQGLADSVTLGVGQFCTNPGLVFVPEFEGGDFTRELAHRVETYQGGTMLTKGIRDAYIMGISRLLERGHVELLAVSGNPGSESGAPAQILTTDVDQFLSHPDLAEEVFGPGSLLVRARGKEQIMEAARRLDGHLTATIHGAPQDLDDFKDLIAILERKVGRIIINGYPTGVEVCHAMVHGGPFPATTQVQSTSVGTLAINRFARPICYQGFPQPLLPPALQDDNPLGIRRMVNGSFN